MSSHTPRTVWLLSSALFTEEVWLTRCQSSEVGLSFKTQCMYDTPTPDRHDKQRSTRHERSVVYLFLVVFVKVPWLFDYCWVEGFCALFPVILNWFIYVSKRPRNMVMMMMMMMMMKDDLSIYYFVFCIFFYTLTAHFRYTKRILRIQVHFILPLRLPSC